MGHPAKITLSVLVSSVLFWKIQALNYKEKMNGREVIFGRFKENTLNYFSEAFRISFWTKYLYI